MKETVVDIDDLKQLSPFFKTKIGEGIGKLLIKSLSIDKVNQAHKNSCHLRGAAFRKRRSVADSVGSFQTDSRRTLSFQSLPAGREDLFSPLAFLLVKGIELSS